MCEYVWMISKTNLIQNSGTWVRRVFHYVDDFIFAGSPTSSHRSVAMATAEHVCTDLGVTIETEKNEGGTSHNPFSFWHCISWWCFTFPPQNSLFWDNRCKHGWANSGAQSMNSCPSLISKSRICLCEDDDWPLHHLQTPSSKDSFFLGISIWTRVVAPYGSLMEWYLYAS